MRAEPLKQCCQNAVKAWSYLPAGSVVVSTSDVSSIFSKQRFLYSASAASAHGSLAKTLMFSKVCGL